MSYSEVMSLKNGIYMQMLQAMTILQAQEQMLSFDSAAYGSSILKDSSRQKMYKEYMKRADPEKFIDSQKKEITIREMGLILRSSNG